MIIDLVCSITLPINYHKIKWHKSVEFIFTVNPALAITCIRRSPFSFAVIENFIWIKPILRGHLSYKATFSSSWGWPLNTGLTIVNVTSYVISVINCEECQANEYNGLDVKWAF